MWCFPPPVSSCEYHQNAPPRRTPCPLSPFFRMEILLLLFIPPPEAPPFEPFRCSPFTTLISNVFPLQKLRKIPSFSPLPCKPGPNCPDSPKLNFHLSPFVLSRGSVLPPPRLQRYYHSMVFFLPPVLTLAPTSYVPHLRDCFFPSTYLLIFFRFSSEVEWSDFF